MKVAETFVFTKVFAINESEEISCSILFDMMRRFLMALKLLRGLFLLWTRSDSGSSLPYVPGGGPSKEWVREHGGTPRCPGCSEEATSSRHSVRCVRRYQRWLRDAVDNALEELDRDPRPLRAHRPSGLDSVTRKCVSFRRPRRLQRLRWMCHRSMRRPTTILVITSHRCPPRLRGRGRR